MRPTQDLESRVLLHDLMCHGDKSITEPQVPGPDGEVPEGHWFSLVRRYVRPAMTLNFNVLPDVS